MIRELGLFAAWLADRALDRIAPPPPYVMPEHPDVDAPAPVGEYPPLDPEQFLPDVPAGGVEAAANSPAGADSATGGHPILSTSQLLAVAAAELDRSGALDLARQLFDRAAQFAAHGD